MMLASRRCSVLAIALASSLGRAQQTVYVGDLPPYDTSAYTSAGQVVCFAASSASVVAVSSFTITFADVPDSGSWAGVVYDSQWNVVASSEQAAVMQGAATAAISATLEVASYWLCFTADVFVDVQASTPAVSFAFFSHPWGSAWPNQPSINNGLGNTSAVYLTGVTPGPPPPPPPPPGIGQVVLQVLPSSFEDCYLELFEQGIEQMEVTNQSKWILVTFATSLRNMSINGCQLYNVLLSGTFVATELIQYPAIGVTFADGMCDASLLSSSVAVSSGGQNLTIVSACYFYNSGGEFSGSVSISMTPGGKSLPTSILTSFGSAQIAL